MAKNDKILWHVEKRKLADLKPHPDNARIFTEKGMSDLKKSISSIGMAQPINITPDGVILSGHARVMALQEKGVDEVDVYIPSRKLTDKEQQEVLIRMNANIAGIFDWDKAANVFEMEDLVDWGKRGRAEQRGDYKYIPLYKLCEPHKPKRWPYCNVRKGNERHEGLGRGTGFY